MAIYSFFSILAGSITVKLKYIAIALTASSAVVSLVAIQDWVMLNIFNHPLQTYAGRVASTFGQPNFYAGYLLLTLPFAGKSGRWGNLVLAGAVLAILISGSRTAILLLPLFFLFWIKDRIRRRKLIFMGITAVFLAVFGVSLYLSFRAASGILWQEIFSPYQATLTAQANPRDSVEKRFFLWPLVWELIKQRPVAGYGLENLGLSWSEYFARNQHAFFEENLSPSSVLIRLRDLTVDRSHSYVLDLLIFSGISGLLAWGFLVFLLFWKLQQKSKNKDSGVLVVSLLIYLIWVQFQNQSIVHLIYFWLMIGLVNRKTKHSEGSDMYT